MTWILSERSKQRREGVDARLIYICDLALSISPIDFGIPRHGGLRLDEVQYQLHLDGKSKCDGIRNRSKHQAHEDGYSKALDFYAYVNGAASWDEYHLTQVAAAFLQAASELGFKLQWGGHWENFKDMPHVQLMED